MISCVVAAAGSGVRIGFKKQFFEIKNTPVLAYSLKAFEESCVDEIVVVTAKNDIGLVREIAAKAGISKLFAVVEGGSTRALSVLNGIGAVRGEYVLIHDGARPFITPSEINDICDMAKKYDAVVAGYPIVDTVKNVQDGVVKETVPRNNLLAAATPQAFKTELIKSAYEKVLGRGTSLTDDSSAVELYGHPVRVFMSSDRNIKITTPKDIKLAEAMLEEL